MNQIKFQFSGVRVGTAHTCGIAPPHGAYSTTQVYITFSCPYFSLSHIPRHMYTLMPKNIKNIPKANIKKFGGKISQALSSSWMDLRSLSTFYIHQE